MYVLNGKYKFEEETVRKILEITPFFRVLYAKQSYNWQQGFWHVLLKLRVAEYFSFKKIFKRTFHHVSALKLREIVITLEDRHHVGTVENILYKVEHCTSVV